LNQKIFLSNDWGPKNRKSVSQDMYTAVYNRMAAVGRKIRDGISKSHLTEEKNVYIYILLSK
jgi:hypothetical protein